MTKENETIKNWQNGILLSAVSYAIYLIFWLVLDDDTVRLLPEMTVTDYLIDFLLCMIFTYISLGFCYIVFNTLPFKASYIRVVMYASCLLIINNLVAFGMTSLLNLQWDETEYGLVEELINMKGAYTFAMVSTFISSVYANTFYLQSDGLSFEALKYAPASVPIIFITAYDEYAVQAFKFNSFDYLLKPLDTDELEAAIDKATKAGKNYAEENLRQLFDALQKNQYRYRERFLLPYRDGYKTVRVSDINHIATENKTVYLRLNNGTSEAVNAAIG